MRKSNLIFIAIIIILLTTPLSVFSAENSPEVEFSNITRHIPWNWWEEGWDKLQELQTFISNYPDKPLLCAQAQYHIGCFYFSIKEYNKAIDAYKTLLYAYPQVTHECQKAQYEIAQIYMNHLNDPEKAIPEYQKVASDYPKTKFTPIAYLMLGRAYVQHGNPMAAEDAFKKVIDGFPEARHQQFETYIELGDLSINQFALSPENREKGSWAISYYKHAYLLCEPNAVSFVIDKISQAFRKLDMSMVRANQFIKYQKYGPQGEDGILGSHDDLTNPLAGF